MLAPLQPVLFLEVARIYALMPDGFWALLSVVVAFYFGGRMQLKRQDMTVKGGALLVAREVVARRNAAPPSPPPAAPAAPSEPPSPPTANRVVAEWRRRQTADAGR